MRLIIALDPEKMGKSREKNIDCLFDKNNTDLHIRQLYLYENHDVFV